MANNKFSSPSEELDFYKNECEELKRDYIRLEQDYHNLSHEYGKLQEWMASRTMIKKDDKQEYKIKNLETRCKELMEESNNLVNENIKLKEEVKSLKLAFKVLPSGGADNA